MFALSKLLWLLLDPLNLFVLLLLSCAFAAWRKHWRVVQRLLIALMALLIVGVLPVGRMLCAALEDRIPPVPPPAHVDGVVLLGGGLNPWLSARRGQPALNDAAERITAFATLARLFPDARLVVSGGNGLLWTEQPPETVATAQLLTDLGVDRARLILEDASRNTYENALNSAAMVHPVTTENWLLVTSAAHMPRALGVFRRQGWNVLPYPVDYRTGSGDGISFTTQPLYGLGQLSEGLHEWAGLIAYRIMDRTDALFPSP